MGKPKPEKRAAASSADTAAASPSPVINYPLIFAAALAGAVLSYLVMPATSSSFAKPTTSYVDRSVDPAVARLKVSIITPTTGSRHHYHEALYKCFSSQTHENKELLVYDDSAKPSPFFSSLSDTRVKYIHIPKTKSTVTVGAKRNRLVQEAQGDLIAHFDDDDYYAPEYLIRMIATLVREDSRVAKLTGWFMYSRAQQFFGYWDMNTDSRINPWQPEQEAITLHYDRSLATYIARRMAFPATNWQGYGFSYLYYKKVWEEVGPFESVNLDEDAPWLRKVGDAAIRVSKVNDHEGIAMKFIHKNCTSNVISQYRLPHFIAEKVFGDNVLPYIQNLS